MTEVLLTVHVLAAILAIGPITVAASVFPRQVRAAAPGDGTAAFLHRVCRGYGLVGLAVPVFGFATGAQLGVLTDAWLIASVVLTAVAAGVLALAILPGQRRLLGLPPQAAGRDAAAARLTAYTGTFNVLWAVVVVLMIVRPGSATGG
ncbi:hypothetical protein HUT06_23325 [Actinomadura sp. NAK00032]|uniref:hypothetical protein n=1 Tax=Actinomadura sp. NAK00032 TaxID=2742128 RepID=UPI0015926E41|nr:hypothetical protein [Actinomadura sp. NAK00032]QKW36589.1 hypothetical protein HUT06_23325 [Actinomadura sp. NAK00032]